ncbi:hypothetical protein AUJ84_03390 [Candidatus Pacearchaeota archaeon CG1_02_32_132]|nr:MAG: hypothetical protein AUJ84_03390 [Candidatus Pacearchaeota archaeon CG1_02_32_132]
MDKPVLIIIDGPMGSGKTVLSRNLHKKMGNCALLSIDVIKNFIYGFHRIEKQKKDFVKYDITSIISKAYLDKCSSVIIEHSFGDKETVDKLSESAKPIEARVLIIKVDAPLDLRMQRVIERDKPLINMKEKLLGKITEDDKSFKMGNPPNYDLKFDTSKQELEEISNKIIGEIRK